jgi:hypothetical protein
MAQLPQLNIDQVFPIPQAMDTAFERRWRVKKDQEGKRFPACITKVDTTGTIVTVKFEVLEPGTNPNMQDLHPDWVLQFPETTMPVATDLYGIPPLQIGDKGYCLPAETDLGGVSGYYDTPTSLTQPFNLSALVFHPIGNVKAKPLFDPSKYYLSGPTGILLEDLSGVVAVLIGPVDDGIGNAIQILQTPDKGGERIAGLLNCPNDVVARSQGIPQYGLYHTDGAVRYQYSVP